MMRHIYDRALLIAWLAAFVPYSMKACEACDTPAPEPRAAHVDIGEPTIVNEKPSTATWSRFTDDAGVFDIASEVAATVSVPDGKITYGDGWTCEDVLRHEAGIPVFVNGRWRTR